MLGQAPKKQSVLPPHVDALHRALGSHKRALEDRQKLDQALMQRKMALQQALSPQPQMGQRPQPPMMGGC